MFQGKRPTIRIRLILLVCTCVVPIWLLSGILIFAAYSSRLEVLRRDMRDPVRQLAKSVDNKLANLQFALDGLATSPAFRHGDLAEIHRQSLDLLKAFPGADIIVADGTGQQLVNSYRPFGTTLPKRNNPATVKKIFQSGKPLASNLYFGAVTGRPLIAVDVPVFVSGQVAYDLSMSVPATSMGSTFLTLNLPPGWYAAVLDGNRNVVAKTSNSGCFVGRPANAALRRALESRTEGTEELKNRADVPVLVTFAQSPSTGWAVLVGVPKSIVMKELFGWVGLLTGGAVVVSLLSILLAMGIVQSIVRSLRSLVPYALSIAQGGAGGKFGEHHVAEIADIGRSLEKTCLLLQQHIERERQHKESLEQSEERYRALVENMPDAIILHRDGVIAYVNRSACRIFAAERPEQLVGTPVLALVHPEHREAVTERMRTVHLRRASGDVLLTKAVRLDGGVIEVESIGAQIIHQGARAIQVVLRDVTARIRAEEALRESDRVLKKLIEIMPVGAFVVDDQGSITYVNNACRAYFGYAREDIPTLADWFAKAYPNPDYRAKVIAELEKQCEEAAKMGSPPPTMEVEVTCKDGTTRRVIANRQFSERQRIVVFTDITERSAREDELLKARKLESLGVLAGGIAHDFNNLLTGIIGNLSLARMFLEEGHKSSQALDNAERAATRAATLTNQLLTFAKGGAPVRTAICIHKVLVDAAALTLGGSNVQAVFDIPDTARAILADEGQIVQAFHNVILNAMQAMPEGGFIAIRAANASPPAENKQKFPAGDFVRVEIADSGSGIAEEIRTRIFDPYFTTKAGNSGLGLASVYSIVAKHGGRVEVSSAVGKGSCFTFWLPAVTEEPAETVDVSAPPRTAHRACGRVLVMDADELIREMASQMLRQLGYSVTTCDDGERAVALYRKALESGNPYSAAIMDLTVPGGMGGEEAARLVRAFAPQANLIVSSGHSNDPVMAEYRRYGFRAALAKPYHAEILVSALSFLDGEDAQPLSSEANPEDAPRRQSRCAATPEESTGGT